MDPLIDGKEIPGFPAYRVTPDGQVWSNYVRGQHRATGTFRLMVFNEETYTSKYRRIILIDSNGKRYSHNVHKLMLETFVGPAPVGMFACHKNGKRYENNIDNLYWGTPLQNQMDRFKHGTACEGEDHYLTKLTNEVVLEIRKLYAEGMSQRRLAHKYNVVRGTISFIVQRKTWKHLNGEMRNEAHHEVL